MEDITCPLVNANFIFECSTRYLTSKRPSTSGHVIFCLLYRPTPMVRCCDAVFLLAETEVPMTTVISSHVKDKNCIFTGYQIFVTGKILVFHRCRYNDNKLVMNSAVRRESELFVYKREIVYSFISA